MILSDEQLKNLDEQIAASERAHYDLAGIRIQDGRGLIDTIADLKRQLRERHRMVPEGDIPCVRCKAALDAYVASKVDRALNEKRLELCKQFGIEPAHSWANIVEKFNEAVEQVDRAVLAEQEAILDMLDEATPEDATTDHWAARAYQEVGRLAANRAKVKKR